MLNQWNGSMIQLEHSKCRIYKAEYFSDNIKGNQGNTVKLI